MTQLALTISPVHGDRTMLHGSGSEFVWCWGLVGGWGWRESHLAATDLVPCGEPRCLRERGHDAPHNPMVSP